MRLQPPARVHLTNRRSHQEGLRRKGEDAKGGALVSTDTVPEGPAANVLAKNEQVALVDPLLTEPCQSPPHELTPKSPASVRGSHGQMMDQTTTAIVSTENRCDERVVVGSNKAEPRIAPKKASYVLERVGIAEPYTLSRGPQCMCSSVFYRAFRQRLTRSATTLANTTNTPLANAY